MITTLFIAFLLLFESNNEVNGSFMSLQNMEFGRARIRLHF